MHLIEMFESPRRPLLGLAALALVLLLGPWAGADELGEEEEERREAVERHTERGWRAFRSGNHDEALARMDRLDRYDPEGTLAPFLRARVAMRTGAYERALETIDRGLARAPGDRRLTRLRYDVLLTMGRAETVLALAKQALEANPKDVAAHAARGLALEHVGARAKALAAYDAVIHTFNAGTSPAEDLPWVARAGIRATRISPNPDDDLLPAAQKLLARWIDDHPDDQDVRLRYADLLQADRGPKGQSASAKRYRQLLKENSELAMARVGLARTFLVFWQQDRAIRALKRALETNPRLVPALSLLASIHVSNGDYESAEKLLRRAKKIRPTDKETRAVEAALAWIRGRKDRYTALERAALAQDPQDGRFFATVSELVGERQRRYDVAATFAQKAIETDPQDGGAYTVLGEALMNLGRTDEAAEVFAKGYLASKRYADVKRDNWREALRILEGFETETTKRFEIRFHPSEYRVMRLYLPPMMEECWDTLATKYGYTPKGPVRIDSFHRMDDFSVRSIGVRGLPALGVCFGEVITVLGPTSRPLGSFSWARTAWHEFAHTITLGQSRGQVPRWLTEGLSVAEEKARRPHWGREQERELYDRLRNGRLLKMARINRAFRGPDILFAYFQGGLIVEHLTRSKGFDVIPAMLREYAKDRTTAEVFEEVLGLELDDYDRELEAYIDSLVGHYRMVPRWDDQSVASFEARVRKDPNDVEAWVRLGWAHLQRGRLIDAGQALHEARRRAPDRPEVILLEGRLAERSERGDLAAEAYARFLETGSDDVEVRMFLAKQAMTDGGGTAKAIEQLEAAKRCFPTHIGSSSPYLALAKLYETLGQEEKAIAELEAYAAIAGESYQVRKDLKDHYRERKDHARVAALSEQMIEISPFGANPRQPPDVTLHRDAAAAYGALGQPEKELRELEAQVEILALLDEEQRRAAGGVKDILRYGRRLLEVDRPRDALAQANAALRLSPEDADARMLKQEAEEAAGYR